MGNVYWLEESEKDGGKGEGCEFLIRSKCVGAIGEAEKGENNCVVCRIRRGMVGEGWGSRRTLSMGVSLCFFWWFFWSMVDSLEQGLWRGK